eukprot:5737691-Amphidinium_carterae.1
MLFGELWWDWGCNLSANVVQLSSLSQFLGTGVSVHYKAPVRGNVTVDGPMSEPWTPLCVQDGFCEAEEAWIGRYFWGPKAIRCVRVITNFTDAENLNL